MEGFRCRLWHLPLLLCLTGLLQRDLCYGQRLVQIQEGPLYRVKGYPISISCNVTGFKGPSEQNFEFILQKSNVDLNMISTTNKNFAYSVFSRRVNEKEIEIERLSGSSVLLRINNLLGEDAGDLFCQTPNTDGEYLGSYEAGLTLNVIEDTLEASYFGSPSQSLTEGDPLQLECQVSSQTYQHTHLSVTWFVHSGAHEDPRPIITLDKDLTVKTGAGFQDRYHSGLISMDKVDDTTYRLKMSQVQLSDMGKIYCKAMEWIQDPDRSWTPIAHKTSTACNVEVKQIEVVSAVGSFSVYMKPSKGTLQVGDALDIHCSVKAQNLPGHLFSVTWLKNQKNVAQIGSSGMLTVFDSYKDRENLAEMRAVKISLTDYLLTIRSARTEDQGQYQCEVWQENMNDDGTFRKIQKQLSSPETVSITAKESDLTVVMEMKDAVTEGDPLQVTCSVSGFKGPLSVSWQHKKDSGDSFSDVISLTNEGVMKDIGTKYQSRHVQTLHSPAGNFTLEIGASARSDSGEYRCIVSEWTVQSNGEMKKANTQTQQKAISVNSVESLMTVTLKSRTTNVVINSSVELLCTVKGPKVSLAVHWMFRSPNSTVPRNILTIRHTGEIAWGADQRNYQLSIQTQPSATQFRLIVPRASKQQEGQYQCQVDAYQKDVQKAMKSSNPLAVTVQTPDSKMSLSKLKSRLETTVNTDVKIECSVLATTTDTSRFTITWMIGSQMLLTMDLDGVLKFGPAGLEMDQRIRMEVRQKQTFQLAVRQVQTTDNGQYHCEVEEWLQDPLGDWYSLKKMSVSTELVVKARASDFRMNKDNTEMKVKEGDQLLLKCLVDGIGSDSTLRYSLSWLFNPDQSSSVKLVTYSYDGRLISNSYNSEIEGRLRFSSPEVGVFHLAIHRAIQEDRGLYYCQVQQYQLDNGGQWSPKASDKSGYTNLSVQLIENKLHVHKENESIKITNLEEKVTIDCIIDSRSSDDSVFEVTWSRGQRNERPIIIFNASRDGTLHSAMVDKDLVFRRPKAMHYKLTVPNINPTDTGLYYCQVAEWIQTAANKWRRIGEDKSGELSVHLDTEESQKQDNFTMDRTEKSLNIKEGEQFKLNCSMNVKKQDHTLHYTLRWVFNSLESTSGESLLFYSYNGHLEYTGKNKNDRLRFSRPSSNTFNLVVLNSNAADSGSYQCIVEQHQLDCDGNWKQTAHAQSGLTRITVQSIESKLYVKKENKILNVTIHDAGFTVDCLIDSQSSDKSAFEVTWFKVQEEEEPVAIFTARHDGILHSSVSDKSLVFGRPLATHYKLTVPQINPTDVGQYYCQVEEWLPTANNWKKLASDKSGELSVSVHTEVQFEDEPVQSADPLGTALGITIPLICFLVLVIIFLLKREHKRKCDLKKKKACLWAENNPLAPMPEVTSAAEDHS
ncbi:immunoglobulin superfamily member 2-like isoform X1 [Pseudorasbora parva]|uniref:immunoglobulin superfamily member 2-like isoform X1 n=1 Tax=Pseudorasbora parva TaxID=51549 RepID=UPI00351E3AF6